MSMADLMAHTRHVPIDHTGENMFSVHDKVFYSSTGVCQIIDIRHEKLGGELQHCYVLKPCFDTRSVVYVPTDQEGLASNMRKTLTRQEIQDLVQAMPQEEGLWISDERERSRILHAKARSCDSHELMCLLRTLYLEKQRRSGSGKGMGALDARLMSAAEKLLHEEFAVVLGIAPQEVLPYILTQLSPSEA